MPTCIRQEDFIQSVADALQYISCFHPLDYVRALTDAWEKEAAPAAKDAMAQILANSRMCAQHRRPICQDTGLVTVFLTVGMHLQWDANMSVEDMVNEGVRRAYLLPENKLRASIVDGPAGKRLNTRDNTPAVVHVRLVEGEGLEVVVAAKGGGSENKARFATLNPSDSVVEWVVNTMSTLGAGWCPPGMLGIGIGGSPEKAMLMAKEALMEPIDMAELQKRGPANMLEALRIELCEKINALGIGAQGLGGLTSVLDVKIRDCPTHAASLPVALIPNCAATRHLHFSLDGSGPLKLSPPPLDAWPDFEYAPAQGTRVDLDLVTRAQVASWKPGDVLLLSGKLLTGRDAAHQRLTQMLEAKQPLPVDFHNRFIYYVGPVDAVGEEAVGPAGPTTATRMDKYTRPMLAQTGLLGMVGKAERGPAAIGAIREFGSVYLIAVGGAAYLVSKAVRSARVLAFEDLGMEAIYEFEVKDMPVTVAVDSQGNSIHASGPEKWRRG